VRGTTRHICRDQSGELIRGKRKDGETKGHLPGCRQGTWGYAVRVPTKEDPFGYLRRGGFETKGKADDELTRVKSLMELAGDNEARRQQIGTAIWKATARGRALDEERIRREVGADRDPSLPVPTVGQWAEDWLVVQDIRPGTRAGHQHRITNYITPWLGDIPLDALRPVHVEAMLDGIRRRTAGESLDDDPIDQRRRQSDAGPAMRRKLVDLLRTIVKAAVDDNVIDRNPIVRYKHREKYRPPERKPWTPEQVRRFLQAAQGDRLAALFRVAALHGLRRGELLGLRWEDLDLDAGILHVRQQIGWFGGKPAVGEPKTESSTRALRLDAGTLAALRRRRHEQREERMRAGPAWQGQEWGLVFAREDGTPLRPYDPLFALQRIAEEAEVPVVTLHTLRHTAATIMLSAGVSPKVASERLGHATVAMTLDLYGHVLPQDDQAAADAVERAVGRLGSVVD
jgi:integrase